MTKASDGLGNALARVGAKVLALGEMSAADILASLSDEQKASLQASLAPPPAPAATGSMPDDGDPEGKCSKCSEPMKDGKCKKCSPDSNADAEASAFAAANARAMAVMSSEHFSANAALAKTLLANDKLSADEINAALAAASSGRSSAADIEEAQRAEMRAAMGTDRNSNIDAGNGGAGANNSQVDHSAGWKKATAAANARYRL